MHLGFILAPQRVFWVPGEHKREDATGMNFAGFCVVGIFPMWNHRSATGPRSVGFFSATLQVSHTDPQRRSSELSADLAESCKICKIDTPCINPCNLCTALNYSWTGSQKLNPSAWPISGSWPPPLCTAKLVGTPPPGSGSSGCGAMGEVRAPHS